MKQNTQIQTLTEHARAVMEKYQEEFPETTVMQSDYLPLKITEEWGEVLQAYLMLTARGRQKGNSKEDIAHALAEELADVFAYLLLFADGEGIDLARAFEKKWLRHLTE